MKNLFAKVEHYRKSLLSYGVEDHTVAHAEPGINIIETTGSIIAALNGILAIIILVSVALPGYCMGLPVLIATRCISKRQASKAKAASSVKEEGRDVIATWKMLVSFVMIPALHIIYTALVFAFVSNAAAIAWFFFSPAYWAVSIFATESTKRMADATWPRCLSIFTPGVGDKLVEERRLLQENVRTTARRFHWVSNDAGSPSTRAFEDTPRALKMTLRQTCSMIWILHFRALSSMHEGRRGTLQYQHSSIRSIRICVCICICICISHTHTHDTHTHTHIYIYIHVHLHFTNYNSLIM